ncbi:DUF6415 family natural product biosynthesis protein [Streptomyces sp. NBC_01017]|uniref:DUF6415 family natural product biosynthesis protein n=1 Tax=Streptomyces sp. NBC_01017 TaxID=2903721 RepID=UPI00386A71DF|nr:DUF6415 family natural product biosynthesis protein [Streptomyces sp. NBC_01017]WSV35145.1 DUF6415 family natural product biosynthesis protein [Streptomyces sp. NBC_01017]
MTAVVQRWNHPLERWAPQLDGEALTMLAGKVRRWQVFDGEALLDDLATVLDDVGPAEQQVDELAERLRGHLVRLVTIAVAAEEEQRDAATARLIEQARTLPSEEVPGDHCRAVGHLRRMGWITNGLLERLVATKCLKETV